LKRPYCLWYIDEVVDRILTGKKIYDKPALNSLNFHKSVVKRGGEDEEKSKHIEELKLYIKEIREKLRKKLAFREIKSSYNIELRDIAVDLPLLKQREAIAAIEDSGSFLSRNALLLKPFISIFYPSDYFTFLEYYISKEAPSLARRAGRVTANLLAAFDEIYKRNLDPFLIKMFKTSIETTRLTALRDMGQFYRQKEEGNLFAPRSEKQEKFLEFFRERLFYYREKELAGILSFCSEIETYFKDGDRGHLDNAIDLLYKIHLNSISFGFLKDKFFRYEELSEEVARKTSLNMECPLIKEGTPEEKLLKAKNKTDILSFVPFFSPLSGKELEKLNPRVKMRKYEEGHVLFNEGDRSEELYIIKFGEVKIFKDERGNVKDYVTLRKGDMFGEMGIIGDVPRSFSAKVFSEKSEIYVIGRDDFFYMFRKYPELSLNFSKILCRRIEETNRRLLGYLEDYFSYIKEKVTKSRKKSEIVSEVAFFDSLSQKEIESLSSRIKFRKFERPSLIFREGDLSDCVYIIKSGEVEILKEFPESNEARDFVTLGKGDTFGEMGVIGDVPRSLSARLTSFKGEMYVIGKEDFLYIFRKYPDVSLHLARILCRRIDDTNRRLLSIL